MQPFKMRFIVGLSLLLWAVAGAQQNVSEFRLPTNFKPISYRLDVTTHLDDRFVFEGVVDIKVSVLATIFLLDNSPYTNIAYVGGVAF